MRLEKLYCILKRLVADNIEITIRDNRAGQLSEIRAEVVLQYGDNKYCWTHFCGKTIEDALRRAIKKLRHPEKDYIDEYGNRWKAKEESCFSEEHIKQFLRKKEAEQ